MTARIPRHLEHCAERLSERDWKILASLKERRYLTTRQLARQFFGMTKTATATPRHANHAFEKLRSMGLVTNLLRRIGGVRAGSAGHVWTLTDTGSRLLAWKQRRPADPRIREYEPSPAFLEHTLAVAEVVLDLKEVAQGTGVRVKQVQFEPAAWRSYLDMSGARAYLKPDLTATTITTEGDVDEWFFEVDRATEAPGRVVKKCSVYQEYRRLGHEQKRLGVFPAVVWVVPNEKRRAQLRERIYSETKLDARLFLVITPGELGPLIAHGATAYAEETR